MKKRIKILIVDDEADMRFFLCNLLGGCGYQALAAADRQDGLRLAHAEKPALIIMDAMMANEDGLAFYSELKQDPRLKRIPVILVSSVGRKTFAQYQRSYCTLPEEETSAPGAYLKKPLNADELVGWVHALTGSAAKNSPQT